jgi:hypothetical protein
VCGDLLARHRDAHQAVHHTARRGHAKGHPARPLHIRRSLARGGSMRRVNTLHPGIPKQEEGVPYHLAVVAEEVTDAVRWVLLVRHTSLRVGVRA